MEDASPKTLTIAHTINTCDTPSDEEPAVYDNMAEEFLIADNSTIIQRPRKALFGRKHAATNTNSSKSKGENHG